MFSWQVLGEGRRYDIADHTECQAGVVQNLRRRAWLEHLARDHCAAVPTFLAHRDGGEEERRQLLLLHLFKRLTMYVMLLTLDAQLLTFEPHAGASLAGRFSWLF